MFDIPKEVVDIFYEILHWIKLYDWAVIGGTIAFAILLISAYKLEQRHIRDFEPVAESKLVRLNPYTSEMHEQARKLGFKHYGWYIQKRKGLYKGIASLWMPPDKLTLVVIAGGKIVGIDLKTTTLYQPPEFVLPTTQ